MSHHGATAGFLAIFVALGLAASLAAPGDPPLSETPTMTDVKPLEAPGIHNVFALGTSVYSGSAPEGEEGFASLAKLGVKTLITVDGAAPDLDNAHKLGMRYVHLPHGYDGISTNTELALVKASRELEGPIYVHCHHGKHRGPTAAAVICMADLGWGPDQAEQFLVVAGTSTNYPGLFQTVRTFDPPTEDQLNNAPDDFPERAKVSGLVDAMVDIDGRWEHLKAVRAAEYRPPPDHPDIDPVNETVILWEHFREAQRLPEVTQHGGDLLGRFSKAEREGREAQRLLEANARAPSPEIRAQLDEAFDAMKQSCAACHKEYRNPAGIKSNH